MTTTYRDHMAKHLRGAANPRAAMREGAAMWRGGATAANPGDGDKVTRYAIIGVLAYLALQWIGPKLAEAQPNAGAPAPDGLGGCGCTT